MINIWTNPNAAQSSLAGGMALANGIGGGIDALGDNITKALEKRKSESQLATTLRKKLSILFPERKDEFNVMNLPDLTGEAVGHAEKIINARHQQQDEAMRLRIAFEKMRNEQEPKEFQQRMEMNKQKLDSTAALPRLYKELSETGQDPESIPGPVSNEEFDRRTAPRDLMTALARSGAAVSPDDAARLQVALEKGHGSLPPGFVPKSATINGVTYGNPKDEKPKLEDHPWLLDDDMEKVKAGLRGIKDPQQRALAIKARNDYEVMQGRPGLLEKLLMGDMGGGGTKPTKPSPDGPKAGDVEDGYRFKGGNRADPKNWEKVK